MSTVQPVLAPGGDSQQAEIRVDRGRSTGGAWFVPAAGMLEACERLLGARFLVVPASESVPSRGALGRAIDDAVEGALAMRGALPPAVEVDADLCSSIRDRLLRVRALDRAGLAIAMPRLGRLVDATGTLDRADSEALLGWVSATTSAPLVLVLEEGDRTVRAFAPVAIEDMLADVELAAEPAPAAEDTEPPPRARVASPQPLEEDEDDGEADDPLGLGDELDETEACAEVRDEDRPTPIFQIAIEHFPEARGPAPARSAAAPVAEAPVAPATRGPAGPVVREAPAGPVVREVPPEPAAERVITAAEWRSFAVDLDAARGPKPARMIDKLFATRYVPLLGAVARGEVDGAVRGVVDGWRTSFEHSYRESFPALRATGKRPPMVFDAPDIAAKIGRLGGARSIKLLLVDAMSFDLGERMTSRLSERLTGKALCVERMLLWSALPTTTPIQLALLGRGADGLRDPVPTSEREPDIARGRAITTLRRERIGSRELMKLDVVEGRLRTAGPAYDDRLDLIAEEIAQIIARFSEGLAARTLLFVFGDHGFRMPVTVERRSTGPATQGGASPEEVLVPGYAWLVGGVH